MNPTNNRARAVTGGGARGGGQTQVPPRNFVFKKKFVISLPSRIAIAQRKNFDDELATKFDKKKKSFQSVCFPRLSKGQARGELASKSFFLGSFISEMHFHIRSLDNMRFHIRSLDNMRFHIRSLDNMRFHIRSLDNMRFHIRSLDNMRFHIRSLDNMRFNIRNLDKKQFIPQEPVTTSSFQEQLVPAECRQSSLTPRTSTSLLSKSSLEDETFSTAASQKAAWKRHFALAASQRAAWQLSFEQPSFQRRRLTTRTSKTAA